MHYKKICCIIIAVICIQYAARVLLAKLFPPDQTILSKIEGMLNDKIDPCDNFYEYVCSNEETNMFRIISKDVEQKIKDLFKRPPQPTDGTAIKQFYKFYQTCKKVDCKSEKSSADYSAKVLYDVLPVQFKQFMDKPKTNNPKLVSPKLIAELAANTAMYNSSFVMPVWISKPVQNVEFIDKYDKVLSVSHPLMLYKGITYEPKFATFIRNYHSKHYTYLVEMTKYLLSYKEAEISPGGNIVSDIIDMEFKIAKMLRANDEREEVEITVGEAMKKMPEFDWMHFILTLEKLTGAKLTQNCKLEDCPLQFHWLNATAEYLKIVSKMPEEDFVTYVLARTLFYTMDDENNCEYLTQNMFPLVKQYLYITETYPTNEEREKLRSSATALADNIVASSRNLIEKVPWIKNEEQTHAGFMEKLDKLQKVIAFPDHLLNQTWLDEQYSDFDSFCQGTCLENKFSLYRTVYKYTAKHYLETAFDDAVDYTDVTGYADHLSNKIYILLGILHRNSFDPDYVPAVKYGDAGFTIGHEIFHHFDPDGIKYDANGHRRKWISENSEKVFNEATQCVVDEYSRFNLTDVRGNVYNVNGRHTLGENIADMGGMLAAYTAFKSDPASNATMKSSVKGLTNEQLFFVSYARTWCKTKPPSSSYFSYLFSTGGSSEVETNVLLDIIKDLDDVHAPSKFRTFGVLRNFVPFREAFKCPVNSNYAPEKHCEVFTPSVE